MTNVRPQQGSQSIHISPWYLIITAFFITSLLTANIIAVKLVQIAGLIVPAGLIVFPLSYIFGDVLTEVYGYRRARLTIWLGFASNLLMVVAIWVGGLLPPAPFWQENQQAYETILGFAPRLLLASFIAYLAGEFANALILARMKIATRGRFLWMRTIGSTIIGQGLDTVIFILVAFGNTGQPLAQIILNQWLIKVAYEALATPLTYAVVNFLKQKEGIDVYDVGTNFNPLSLTE
ncbi:MAG: transporter [Herpetosiphonaceae bacterium]|nr:MAG: transporter [Herpetosiphonaceae bacterium]